MASRLASFLAAILAILLSPSLMPNDAVAQATGAAPGGTPSTSITREEFRQQLLQAFPMEQPAHEGGTLILGDQSDISTVNGILAADSQTFLIAGAVYETLVGGSPIDGQVVPALADSWEISPDGLTYTFHLNQAAKWHDGTDFTAADVEFSFDAVLDPNTGSIYTTTVNDAVAS